MLDQSEQFIRYVFLDVVSFSKRVNEAQRDIIETLNECVKTAGVPSESIFLPTGDGICVAILDKDAPHDCHLIVALTILANVKRANENQNKRDRRFEIRIGLNDNTDSVVIDINARRNVAGYGINFAQRAMSHADGGQIMVTSNVFSELNPHEKYHAAFRHFQVVAKGNTLLELYQFIQEGHLGLNVDQPRDLGGISRSPLTLKRIKQAGFQFYNALRWGDLLAGATRIDLCVFYCSREWLASESRALKEFLRQGGAINLYLPARSKFLWRRIDPSRPTEDTISQIDRTAQAFIDLSIQTNSNSLKIFEVYDGITSMMSRIQRPDRDIYMFSPFRMHRAADGQPIAFVFEGQEELPELATYIDAEILHLSSHEPFKYYESTKHLFWPEDHQDRLFVSSALGCSATCKYCYVESLRTKTHDPKKPIHVDLLFDEIMRSSKFRPGKNGTRIFFGGFSDPFSDNHIAATVELIERIAGGPGNLMHVATKFSLPHTQISRLAAAKSCLCINVSISTLDRNFERGTELAQNRFQMARKLLDMGIFTALYLRPVIVGKTLLELPDIVKKARESGISVATVGGLYCDASIQKRLELGGVRFGEIRTSNKQFVLDEHHALEKHEYDDVERVKEYLQNESFNVFSSSQEVLDHFYEKWQA